MDKDNVLRQVFATIATTNSGDPKKGAGVCVLDGMEYDICHTCVLQIDPLDCYKDAKDGEMMDFDEIPPLRLSDPTRVKPEILLDADSVPLDKAQAGLLLQPDTYMIPALKQLPKAPAGLWLVSAYNAGGYGSYVLKACVKAEKVPNMAAMKILAYSVTPELAGVVEEYGVDIMELNPCIRQTRLQMQPVLVLTGETGLLYTPLRRRSDSDSIRVVSMPELGINVYGDAWSDETQAYRKLIVKKELVMKGMLGNPLAAKKPDAIKPVVKPEEEKAEPAEVEQADGSQPEVAAAVAAQVDASVKPAEDGVTEAEEAVQAEAEAEPAAEEAAAAETAEEQAEPEAKPAQAKEEKPKAQRTQKPVQKGGVGAIDLKRALEILNTTVASITPPEYEKALNALRMLRDIQIAAARLETNIALAIAEPSQKAMQAVAEFQKMLGGK